VTKPYRIRRRREGKKKGQNSGPNHGVLSREGSITAHPKEHWVKVAKHHAGKPP